MTIRCAALGGASRDTDALRALSTGITDWTTVLSMAQRHGVVALLHRSLRAVPWGGVPSRVVDVLERWTARAAVRHEGLRSGRDQLLDRFVSRRIPVIPLRCARVGPMSGELIEVDLLVQGRDVTVASQVLLEDGLEPEPLLGAEPAWGSRNAPCTRRFVHPRGYVVSLQWDVADAAVFHGPSIDDAWRRAVAVDRHATLERADLLLLLCVRGTIKRWLRLAWIREVAELMAETDARELELALERATRGGARRALALGTTLAGRLLGAPLSTGLRELARDAAVPDLERDVLSHLVAPSRPLHGPWRIARFHVRSRERVRDRICYVIRRATLPRPEDVAELRLPPRPSFRVHALSPFRRAIKAGDQWVRRARGAGGQKLARFGRTPLHVVDRMLALAGANGDDTVFDLGCGDGAIVIRAAQRLGCRGVGVDLDTGLIDAARAKARAARVDHLTEFRHGDVLEMDLTEPTVVCLYLNTAANLALRPHLQRRLRPGTRIVCFNFTMGDWWPDAVEVVDETPWGSNTLYLWKIPQASASQPAA